MAALNQAIAENLRRIKRRATKTYIGSNALPITKKAPQQLQSAVELSNQRTLSDLEKQGVIQIFEFTHELAWNVLKDYLQDQGNQNIPD